MTKNVTLRLNAELLRQIQHFAVEEGLSLSAWIAKKLAALSEQKQQYQQSKRHALTMLQTGFHLGGSPLSRDDIHER